MLSISEILRTKLIPWSLENAGERFIVAHRKMSQTDMPYNVQLVSHRIQSKRVPIKNKRCYNNVRNIIAEWPEAGLHELGKYVLVCVLDGHIDYQLGNYKVKCGPGHFIFIPPGIPHPNGGHTYVDTDESTFCNIVTFLLHPNALECWASHGHVQGREQYHNCLILYEHAVSLLRALTQEIFSEKPHSVQISENLLSVFFEMFLREIDAGDFQKVRSTVQAEQKVIMASSVDFRTHLELYVQTNLQKQLTLKDTAAEMYYSPAQFTRVMRRETGKSFIEYLGEQRIAEAKEHLRKTDWTITAIATMVGIKSHRYFRTLFKRHTGLTPIQFRMNELKKRKNDLS